MVVQPTALLPVQDYSVEQLEVGYETGADRLLLWLPMVVTHVIDDSSPLANWRDPETVLSDSDATIVVVVCPQHTKLLLIPKQSVFTVAMTVSSWLMCLAGRWKGTCIPWAPTGCACACFTHSRTCIPTTSSVLW